MGRVQRALQSWIFLGCGHGVIEGFSAERGPLSRFRGLLRAVGSSVELNRRRVARLITIAGHSLGRMRTRAGTVEELDKRENFDG